jgi:hypothetical protein
MHRCPAAITALRGGQVRSDDERFEFGLDLIVRGLSSSIVRDAG